MKFIEEKALREAFWDNYKHRSGVLRHQFEAPVRHGGIDLLTVEEYAGRIYFVAFEFKLDDVKKALAQAEENLKYVHKSFIVIPEEKCQTVVDKYADYLKEHKWLSIIGVDYQSKRWKMHYPVSIKPDALVEPTQEIWKLMLNKI